MKTIFKTILAFIAISISACATDDEVTPPPPPPVTNGSAGFSWRENDPASTTIQNATTASFSNQSKTLIAKNVAGNTIFTINLTGTTAGTYNFGSGTGNTLTYTVPSPAFVAESGAFIITANASGKMSGSFEAFRFGNNTVSRLYGSIINITVNP